MVFFFGGGGGGREHHDFIIIIIIIIIPLFITFGDKNYGNITIKFKTLHIIYTYQIRLSLAPMRTRIRLSFAHLMTPALLRMLSFE